MANNVKKRKHQVMLSLAVPLATCTHLDYLVGLFENYRPQVVGYPFKRVNRSQIVRMALAYLHRQAELGNVGPELLGLTGQDRRVATEALVRRA